MSDQSPPPEPFSLKPLFQDLDLCGFLPRMEGFQEKQGLKHHVLSLLTIGLLVVSQEKSQLPRGQIRFGKTLGKRLPMLRDCARNRGDNPGGRPGRDRPLSDQL